MDKKIKPTELSQTTVEDLIKLILSNEEKQSKIETEIDSIVRQGIELLPLKKQKRLEKLTNDLIKLNEL